LRSLLVSPLTVDMMARSPGESPCAGIRQGLCPADEYPSGRYQPPFGASVRSNMAETTNPQNYLQIADGQPCDKIDQVK
jgi:hypothetical protein